MMLNKELLKIVKRLGVNACGIAGVDRFSESPKGLNPKDVYSKCKSVVVFLKTMPPEAIMAENPVVYTHTAFQIYSELDRIGLALTRELERNKIHCVPVPTDTPYLYWDAKRTHGMGIISPRHSGYLAGLGILGRNTLLINKEFGNMVYIGAVLVDAELEQNPIVTNLKCPQNCTLCLDACPVKALDGITVSQYHCRKESFIKNERGFDIYKCGRCRQACPIRLGRIRN